jgi:hypothetical protein
MKRSATRDKAITVSVRVRPLNERERRLKCKVSWKWDQQSVQQTQFKDYASASKASKQELPPAYNFDHVFAPEVESVQIYDDVIKDTVIASMEGYHAATFAYGQTSTGKTFTMQGTKTSPGLIPLAIENVFSIIKSTPAREFLLRVSYLEIYNENINDLLSPASTNIKIYDSKQKGVIIRGLKEEIVISPEQIFALISSGEAHRHIGSTDFNELSSRSHTIFRMTIESRIRAHEAESQSSKRDAPVRVSTLALIDLAGSESVKLTKSTGSRKAEGGFINKSLLTLSHVIWKLSSEKTEKAVHIPYRDSKLTRMLQPALGGNAQISIVCTVTPSHDCLEETHNTLKFGSRAKVIKQCAVINEVLGEAALLRKYKMEIEDLRHQLAAAKEQQPAARPAVSAQHASDEDDDDDRADLENAIQHLQRIILTSVKMNESINLDHQSGSPLRSSPHHSPGRVPFTDTPSPTSFFTLESSPRHEVELPPQLALLDSHSEIGMDHQENQLVMEQAQPAPESPPGADFADAAGGDVAHSPEPATPLAGPMAEPIAITNELQGIQVQLKQLLQKKTAKRTIGASPFKTPVKLLHTPVRIEEQLATMKANLKEQALSLSVSKADTQQLEQQLVQRDTLLTEWGDAMEAVEKRQAVLEQDNERLAQENAQLKADVQRMSTILQAREAEMHTLKGVDAHEETF